MNVLQAQAREPERIVENDVEKLKEFDVLILKLVDFYWMIRLVIEYDLDERMRNGMWGFLQFRHIIHVGFYLLDANRGLQVSGAVRM
jgi:hypothetical protein